MIERESVKSVGAYLESQAEAMRQALAALIEIPSYRTQAEEGAPYGKGPAAALQEGMRLAQEQGLRTRLVENVMLEADLGEDFQLTNALPFRLPLRYSEIRCA